MGALAAFSACRRAPRDTPVQPEVFVTTADRRLLLVPLADEARDGRYSGPGPGDAEIAVHVADRKQPITGFGAALTDASVQLLRALPDSTRRALLQELFDVRDGAQGIGLRMVRVPIGASDFSSSHYTLHDTRPHGDSVLTAFDFSPERDRVAMLRALRVMQPSLAIMGTPWSAPAWMKTSMRLAGGTLRADALPVYSAYLERVVTAYDSAGVALDYLSVQNEPQHEPPDYPGMRLSPGQRAELVGGHLGPRLARLPRAPKLLEWDHNWDAPEEPLAVLRDMRARSYLHGVAWHCYAGQPSAQSLVHEAFPTVATFFTECAGGAWAPDFGDNLLWNVRTLVIGATQHWAQGVLLWNLALDPSHAPHLGGCTNCRGVLTIDARTRSVTRNEEYYALAHASRGMQGDAWRQGWRVGSEMAGADTATTSTVSFANARGQVTTVIAHAGAAPQWVVHRVGDRAHRLRLPARSVVTIVWH